MKLRGLTLQYLAGYWAAAALFAVGNIYAWINPVFDYLTNPDVSSIPMTKHQGAWIASLPEVGSIITSLPAGFLVDITGRKIILVLSAPILLITWIVIGLTNDFVVLIIVRTIQGLVVGFVCTVVPIYLSEIAEPKVRGRLGNLFSLAFCFGLLFDLSIGPFVSYQLFAFINIIPTLVIFLTFYLFPETPYYLLLKGKIEDAKTALESLRSGNVEEELSRMIVYMDEEHDRGKNLWHVVSDIRVKLGLMITCVITTASFLGGFTVIMSYSSVIFYQTSDTDFHSGLITIIFGIFVCIIALAASYMLDFWGRRPSLLFSFYLGAVVYLIPAFYYLLLYLDVPIKPWWPLAVTAIIIGALLSLISICVIKTYQSELFPTKARGFTTGVNTTLSGIVSTIGILIYYPLEHSCAVYVNYFLFATVSLIGGIFVQYKGPETKGKTLEEIQDIIYHHAITRESSRFL